MRKKEILVIIAHPDDETIWMGGTLLRTKFKKTIICLCRKKDKDRNPKFKKACKILNAKGHISDLDDCEKGHYEKISSEDIIKRILKIIKNKDYYHIFTHGKNGEYFHIRHREIHDAIIEMLKKRLLSAKKVFFFAYSKRKNNFQEYAIYKSNADKLIKLNHNELFMKKHLIQDIYGYLKGGFEERSSGRIESFNKF